MPRTLGISTAAVLQTLRGGRRYGLEIIGASGLPTGTVYKTLTRLEARGYVMGRWEDAEVAEAERRPRRRYYRITPDGEKALQAAVERYRAFAAESPGGDPLAEVR